MAATDVFAAAQDLYAEGLVELFELDTNPLFVLNGTQLAGGYVYRWVSGVIDARTTGLLNAAGTNTTEILTLDKVAPLVSGNSYSVAIAFSDVANSTLTPVGAWSTVTVNGTPVTQLVLSVPLSQAPGADAAYGLVGTNAISFGGNVYSPMPIQASGFAWSGQGKMPRPILRVGNVGLLASSLVIGGNGLLGAQVTRIRTFREFLDDGSNPDPTAYFVPDIFLLDRISAMNKNYVEFELAAALEQQGLRIPRRVMLRDSCGYIYRQWATPNGETVARFVYGTCPYTGGAMFDHNGNAVSAPPQDVCGLRMSDCLLRFGSGTPLPFNAFPGISSTTQG